MLSWVLSFNTAARCGNELPKPAQFAKAGSAGFLKNKVTVPSARPNFRTFVRLSRTPEG